MVKTGTGKRMAGRVGALALALVLLCGVLPAGLLAQGAAPKTPVAISSAEDFATITDLAGSYVQTADIVITPQQRIKGRFSGSYDGGGHTLTVSGGSFEMESAAYGLFADALGSGARVSGLTVKTDGMVTVRSRAGSNATSYIGGIAGRAGSNAVIENSGFEGTLNAYAAPMAGGAVPLKVFVGGIAGRAEGTAVLRGTAMRGTLYAGGTPYTDDGSEARLLYRYIVAAGGVTGSLTGSAAIENALVSGAGIYMGNSQYSGVAQSNGSCALYAGGIAGWMEGGSVAGASVQATGLYADLGGKETGGDWYTGSFGQAAAVSPFASNYSEGAVTDVSLDATATGTDEQPAEAALYAWQGSGSSLAALAAAENYRQVALPAPAAPDGDGAATTVGSASSSEQAVQQAAEYGVTAQPAGGAVQPGDTIVFTALPAGAQVYIEVQWGGDSPYLPTLHSANGAGSVSYVVPQGATGTLKVLAAIIQDSRINYCTPQPFEFTAGGAPAGLLSPQVQQGTGITVLAAGTASGVNVAPANGSYVDLNETITLTSTDTGVIHYAYGTGTPPAAPEQVTWIETTSITATVVVPAGSTRGSSFYVVARTKIGSEEPNDMRTFTYTIKTLALAPVISVANEDEVLYNTLVTLTNRETSGTMYYKTNLDADYTPYTAPFQLTGGATLSAYVADVNYKADSNPATVTYTVKLGPPLPSKATGSQVLLDEPITFSIPNGPADADITYKITGGTPVTIKKETPVYLTGALGSIVILTASLSADGYVDSRETSYAYGIAPNLSATPAPDSDPLLNPLTPGSTVTLETTYLDNGSPAIIYYTAQAVNEPSDPTLTSYSGYDDDGDGKVEVTVPANYGNAWYIKASVLAGGTLYGPNTYTYAIKTRAPKPTVTLEDDTAPGQVLAEGTALVLKTTEGRVVYTTDGSDPDPTENGVASGTRVEVTGVKGPNFVLRAITVGVTGKVESEETKVSVQVRLPKPMASVETGGNVKQNTSVTFTLPYQYSFYDDKQGVAGGATIWYTYATASPSETSAPNPENPASSQSTRYSSRDLNLSAVVGTKVRVMACVVPNNDKYATSEVATWNYVITGNLAYNITPAPATGSGTLIPISPGAGITIEAVSSTVTVSARMSDDWLPSTGTGSVTVWAPNAYNYNFTVDIMLDAGGGNVLSETVSFITMAESRQPTMKRENGTDMSSYDELAPGEKVYLSSPDGGRIYYNIGSAPTINDRYLYDDNQGITITSSSQRLFVRAVGVDSNGFEMAPTQTYSWQYYVLSPKAPAPVSNVAPPADLMRGSAIELSIPEQYSEYTNANIYYTITYGDGTKKNGTIAGMKGSVLLDGEPGTTMTISAYANGSGLTMSAYMDPDPHSYGIIDVDDSITSVPAVGSTVTLGDTILLTSGVQGGNVKIHYTTDGTTPRVTSPNTDDNPIYVKAKPGGAFTVRAIIAISDTVLTPSPVQFDFVVDKVTMTAIPDGGTTVKPGESVLLSTNVPRGVIYYTTDGSIPTTSSSQGSVITVPNAAGSSFPVKAITVFDGVASDPATFTYTIMEQTAPPYASIPTGAILLDGAKVELSAAEGRIFYTTDGTTPTTSSRLYTEPLSFTASAVVRAIAVADDKLASAVASFTYNLAGGVVAPMAEVQPQAGSTTTAADTRLNSGDRVALSSGTADATIYYTTNGTDPSAANLMDALLYDSPIVISRAVTIKAIAVKEGLNPSVVATFAYTVAEPDAETDSDEGGVVLPEGDKLFGFDQYAGIGSDPQYPVVLRDRQHAVVLSGEEDAISEDMRLEVTQYPSPSKMSDEAVQRALDMTLAAEYEITLWRGELQIQLPEDGLVEIGLPLPAAVADAVVKVVRINDDGTVTPLQTRRGGNTAYATVNHLSKYGIAVPVVEARTQAGIWRYVLIIGLPLAGLVLVVTAIAALRRRRWRRLAAEQAAMYDEDEQAEPDEELMQQFGQLPAQKSAGRELPDGAPEANDGVEAPEGPEEAASAEDEAEDGDSGSVDEDLGL